MRIRHTIVAVTLIAAVWGNRADAASGRIAGQFDVSLIGTAQYSVPIWLPPGIAGLQPHLALRYDSQLSYGIMGPGWTLSGLSTISRCNRTFAQDGVPAPVTLTATDAFCVDGNRLRTVGTGVYQTEIANFSQITQSGTAGTGPSFFTVKGKDGLSYEYGNTADSKILVPGNSTPVTWAVDKVTDRSGNYMTVTYTTAGGAFVPSVIKYSASSGSTSFLYNVNFTYSAKLAIDTISKTIAGSQVQQTQQLTTITVQNASTGVTLRDFNLAYTAASTTGRARLHSIQECGGSAGTDCLSPTAITYQDGVAGIAAPATSAASGATNGTVRTADLDGDGRKDLIFATGTGPYTWWVQFATGTGYSAPVSVGAVTTNIYNVLIDTFEGRIRNQILAPNSSNQWVMYDCYGGSCLGSVTTLSLTANAYYASADVDGDGIPDIAYATAVVGGAQLGIQLNTGFGTSFAAPTTQTIPGTSTCCSFGPGPGYTQMQLYGDNSLADSSIQKFDFDGDGRHDLLLHYYLSNPPPGFSFRYLVPILTRGAGAVVAGAPIYDANGYTGLPLAVQWNDDACTDLVFGTTLYLSQCNGVTGTGITLPVAASLAVDWDGDGRSDLLSSSSGSWQLIHNPGYIGTPFIPAPVSAGIGATTGTWIITDQDGDGLDDLVRADPTLNNALYFSLHNGAALPPDLATQIADGYGVTFSPTYIPLAQQANGVPSPHAVASAVKPLAISEVTPNFLGPMSVVSSASISDGIGSTYEKKYIYSDGVMDLQGRGFLGFQIVEIRDTRIGNLEVDFIDGVFPTNGFISQTQITDINGTGLSVYNIAYPAVLTLDATPNNQRYFPYRALIEYQDLLNNTDTSTTFSTPDIYGNFPTWTTVMSSASGSRTSTTTNTYSPQVGTWCLSLPTATAVTNSSTLAGGTAITRTVNYNNPDYTNCRQTEKITEPSSASYKVVEDFGYDSFGNLHTDKVTGIGMTPRTTTITWTASGQFPQTVQNPLLQSITLGYDVGTGMKTSQTDPNYTTSNPLKTSWTYDNFARQLTETRPDGTGTSYAYALCASACVNSNNKLTVTQTTLNVGGGTQSTKNTYLDWFDRPLVTSKVMLSGAFDRQEVQYDSRGNVQQQGAPCTFTGCTNYWTTFQYDAINRVVKMQRPVSSTNATLQTTSYVYSSGPSADPLVTITDPLGHSTSKTYPAGGGVGQTKDATGYFQNFVYDSFGSLLSVTDSASNTLFTATYDYGIGPFQRNVTDMDLDKSTASGQHRAFNYDALGELTSWSDAKGQNFSETYDLLSRPLVRTEPDLATTWTWGSAASSFSIGKLAVLSSTSSAGTYSDTYLFDTKTRLSTDTKVLPGDGSYVYTFAYNATTGLADTLQYPVSTSGYQLKLQYGYANGLLKQISDFNNAATVYWAANSVNPRGQWTKETLGNGVVKTQVYDAVTGWVGVMQAGIGTGSGRLNFAYLYDMNGNVTQRQDNNLGLTESVFYDSDDRFDHSTLNGAQNLKITYDTVGMGNIASRSDLAGGAAWTYDTARKHAVTQAGSSANSYSYDNNGNAITRNGSSISWSSYNYPTAINSSTESVTYEYGPNRQRWKTQYMSAAGIETTYNPGKFLEKVASGSVTDYRHYIFAGVEPVAIYSRTTAGANTLRYVVEDYQGSVAAILTDSTPGPVTNYVNESFSAYGNRRNHSTWSGAPSTSEENSINSVSREGYTFHTAIGVTLGLNHMNGRVQDAITGRFLSPDPSVPNPGNTQSFNRYSYVNNNPLSYIDPTGFDDEGNCSNTAPCDQLPEYFVQCTHGCGPDNAPVDPPAIPDLRPSFPSLGIPSLPSSAQQTGTVMAQSQTSGGSTVWNDPNDATAGITAYGSGATQTATPDAGAVVSVLGPESLPLLAPIVVEATAGAARTAVAAVGDALGPSGNIFGRARLGGSSAFGINSNSVLRIGWGWVGSATDGTNVFRISGDFIDWLGVEGGHIDLFTWP